MLIYLTGVLENGTPHDERLVPYNPRRPIRYTRGVTMEIQMLVLGRDGVPVDLSGVGTTVTLTVKQSSELDENVLSLAGDVSASNARDGHAVFSVPAAALRDWAPGRYVFDVWLNVGSSRDCVLPASPFIVEPTVRSLV